MANENDENKPENIRYNLGVMEHTLISSVDTHSYHQHGLKNRDPVVIIHKDDFKKIINVHPDKSLKDKFFELLQSRKQLVIFFIKTYCRFKG